MHKELIIAAVAAVMLLAPPGLAQTPETPLPENPTGDTATRPLMTAPQPEDTPTTPPTLVTPGVDGDAPSTELTETADPIIPGAPDERPTADDAPAARNRTEDLQNREQDQGAGEQRR